MEFYKIFVLILVSCYIPSVLGCSCLPTSSRKKFCDADFVILARVISTTIDNTNLGSGKSYSVEVIASFKGSLIAGQTRTIITAIQGATCGVQLSDGGFYLLAGQEDGPELRINLCGWNVKWQNLKPNERSRLWNGAYNCRIVSF
ncbi:hypothetical protein KUTeg_005478 [Tegillarca granosa]|uniref:NTR domain-containing protein n=1 Tax=Tegillarca granosa TaxID=220873 RepID=A0ABQ9FJW3_TEGGR|nr:hypothetical protein KUTeg_005478 [Tegillarca granosa]